MIPQTRIFTRYLTIINVSRCNSEPKHGRKRAWHRRGVDQGGQIYETYPVFVEIGLLFCHRLRDGCFSDAAWADDRREAASREPACNRVDAVRAPDHPSQPRWYVACRPRSMLVRCR